MFSYFEKGIKDITPKKTVDFPGLIKIIKSNPEKESIEVIRQLKIEGNNKYKDLKQSLPNITPNCTVKCRNLSEKNFDLNFKEFSQYIYFDVDNIHNVEECKQYFIKRYGHQVSMVSKSSSCSGLSILFKITNTISNKEQFSKVWDEIRNTIFKDEEIDIKCKDIGRAMYISYDPDVYYNYDNEISLHVSNTETCIEEKSIKQSISYEKECNNRLNDTFYKKIPFDEVMKKICLKTTVNIDKPVVEIIPVDFTEVRFPFKILDNNKHRVYTGMIHSLVNLNPSIEPDYLFSYMDFINNRFAAPSMEFKKLIRLFNFVYNSIKNNEDYKYSNEKVKWVHFNKHSHLTGNEKKAIAANLNGKRRTNMSIERIQLAKNYLESSGQKITQKLVAELTSLSIATVKRHFHKAPADLNELINNFNETPPFRSNRICFKDRASGLNSRVPENDYIHPDCPQWVLDYIFNLKNSIESNLLPPVLPLIADKQDV
jgi:hypothetical protein